MNTTNQTRAPISCCVCGDSEHRPKWSLLLECQTCGFVFFNESNQPDLTKLYTEDYFHGGEYTDYLGEEPALRRSMKRHLDQMARYQTASDRLLEVGCAYGFFLNEAKSRYSEVIGIDIAEEAVSHAKQNLEIQAHTGDFTAHPFTQASFDTICLWDTIEHLPNPDQFGQRALDLLKPGGHVFLTTGDISAFNARLRGRNWRQIHPPTHVSYFSRATMKRMLERIGFEEVSFETASYYHTLRHILGAIKMRKGILGSMAGVAQRLLSDGIIGKCGFWLNLGDTMFVSARRPKT